MSAVKAHQRSRRDESFDVKYPQGDSNPLHVLPHPSRKGKPVKEVTPTPREPSQDPLAHSLARETQIGPDLQRIQEAAQADPLLRAAILAVIDDPKLRAAILAVIDAARHKKVDRRLEP